MADEGSFGFEMDDKTAGMVKKVVSTVVSSDAFKNLVKSAAASIAKLVVTSYKKSDLTGDTEMKPSEDTVAINKVETAAADTDAALAKDEVTGVDGDLSAAQTEAIAATGEATALESGATAARTKAGAADIETKGLKMT